MVTSKQQVGEQVRQELQTRIDAWLNEAGRSTAGRVLGYRDRKDGRTIGLLRYPDLRAWSLFTCLNSLRDVEPSVGLILDERGMDSEPERPLVAAFPRWMVCPYCRVLAPLDSGLFQLKVDPFRPDRTGYIHQNCTKPGRPPTALPARFLVACEHGHLDDFPWIYFVHQGQTECQARLRLREFGVSGEAADIQVTCEECKASRRMGDAFGADSRAWLPLCRGRRPHLRDYDGQACPQPRRTSLLGARNSW